MMFPDQKHILVGILEHPMDLPTDTAHPLVT